MGLSTDREKVIKALRIMQGWFAIHKGMAKDKDEEEMYDKKIECLEEAMEMLKEREAVKPKHKERIGGFIAGLCPTCGTVLNNILNVKACGKCGQAVKWDE